MNYLTPYVPGKPDTVPEPFDGAEQLGDIPHVRKLMDAPGFSRLSLDLEGKPSIMAEFRGCSTWVVVGYVKDPKNIELPHFQFRSLSFLRE